MDVSEIMRVTKEHYEKAKESISEIKMALESCNAISDTVPGYKAEKMLFGAYERDNFAVLFIDIRNSTRRAEILGPKNTFLTMHAFIPAMMEVIKCHKGYVIDIMGDGIMVFFGGRNSKITQDVAIQNAGLCGIDMLDVKDKVTNKLLRDDGIAWEIQCGIGVDYGDVIVTKIGVQDIYDVKAFGDCINSASHYSNGYDQIRVSKQIKKKWPKGKNGKIAFSGSDEEGYILTRK